MEDQGQKPLRRKMLSHYLTKIARLGGYLARANDPPPGNTVMWRGLTRLTDIELGATIGVKIVKWGAKPFYRLLSIPSGLRRLPFTARRHVKIVAAMITGERRVQRRVAMVRRRRIFVWRMAL
jgi:hypothetical protein